MNCIVCDKKSEEELCEECDRLMEMLYKKRPDDKEIALKLFRERGGKKK